MFSGPIQAIRNRKNDSNEGISVDSQSQDTKEISLENNHSDCTPLTSPTRGASRLNPAFASLVTPKSASTPKARV